MASRRKFTSFSSNSPSSSSKTSLHFISYEKNLSNKWQSLVLIPQLFMSLIKVELLIVRHQVSKEDVVLKKFWGIQLTIFTDHSKILSANCNKSLHCKFWQSHNSLNQALNKTAQERHLKALLYSTCYQFYLRNMLE